MEKRLYNLDALRFIAAWIVLLSHVEVIKPHFEIPYYDNRFFQNAGQIAVTFFFELSGFLISWFLLTEKKKSENDRINVGKFYARRILRIWPLYYLLIVLCFFVLRFIPFFNDADYSNYFQKGDQKAGLFYFLIFFPNYSLFNYGSPLYLGQLWTLGVEEFFYLFFPIFIYFIPYKKIPKFLIASGTVFIIASVLIGYYLIGSASRLEQLLVVYADKYRIYSFALGGLAAYYYLEENPIVKLKRLLSKKAVAYGLLLIIFMCVVTGLTFSVMTQQVYSVYFFVLLLALLLSGIKPWLLNNRLSVYLGKISYGFYMLHVIAIVIVLKWLYPLLQTGNTFFNSLLIYFFTTVCTILLAIVSWHAFEKYFLRLRNKL